MSFTGAGAVWRQITGEFRATNHPGDQSGYDAAKAEVAASGGTLDLGPGMEAISLGTLNGITALILRTNTGIYGLSRLHILDGTDPSKRLRFDASAIAAATTRVATIPNWSGFMLLPVDLGLSGQFLRSNGAGVQPSWAAVSVSNALLDGVNHTDTIAQAVLRGALVIGNSTPKWDRLTIGAASTLLRSDGLDPSWGTVDLLSAFHADTLAAAVAAGDIIIGNATPKWARLAKGTDGQVLTLVSGLPAWSASGASLLEHNALFHLKPISAANCTWSNGSAAISTTGGAFANVRLGDIVVTGTNSTPGNIGRKVTVITDTNNITVDEANTGSTLSAVTLIFIPGDHWDDTINQDSNGAGVGLMLTRGRGKYSATGPGTTFQELRGPIRWMSDADGSVGSDFRVQGSTSLVSPFGFRISKSTSIHATLYVNDLTASRTYRLPNSTDETFLMNAFAQDVSSKTLKTGNILEMDETGGTANGTAFRDRSGTTKGLGFDISGVTAGQNRVAKWQDHSFAGHVEQTYVTRTTGIDAAATGTTNLFTVPSGKSFIVTRAVVRCTSSAPPATGPTFGIGVAAGEDDIMASVAHATFVTADTFVLVLPKDPAVVATSAQIIKIGIDTAAAGGAMTIAVDLAGYLV